jgi:tRNA 2-thiouridine synthesizing protein A
MAEHSPDSDEPVLVLDCRGMLCPLPIIELGRAWPSTSPGQLVDLVSDDPAAATDVAAWCRMRGQELVGQTGYEVGSTGRAATAYRIRHI